MSTNATKSFKARHEEAARRATLTRIAKEYLNLPTLNRQGTGADFQEQAVWVIEAALVAAFEAGRKSQLR